MADLKEMTRAELLEEAKGMGYIGISAYSKADLLDLVKKERAALARAATREAKKAEKLKAEKAAARAAAREKKAAEAQARAAEQAEATAEPEVVPIEPPAPAPNQVSTRFQSGTSPTRYNR